MNVIEPFFRGSRVMQIFLLLNFVAISLNSPNANPRIDELVPQTFIYFHVFQMCISIIIHSEIPNIKNK